VYDANGTVINRKTASRQAALMPKVEGVPRYKDFNTIRKNHHVKDEEVLRYVPYFGETDDVDLTEAYKVEVRSVEEEEDLERESLLWQVGQVLLTVFRRKNSVEDCGTISGNQQCYCRASYQGAR